MTDAGRVMFLWRSMDTEKGDVGYCRSHGSRHAHPDINNASCDCVTLNKDMFFGAFLSVIIRSLQNAGPGLYTALRSRYITCHLKTILINERIDNSNWHLLCAWGVNITWDITICSFRISKINPANPNTATHWFHKCQSVFLWNSYLTLFILLASLFACVLFVADESAVQSLVRFGHNILSVLNE